MYVCIIIIKIRIYVFTAIKVVNTYTGGLVIDVLYHSGQVGVDVVLPRGGP